MSRRALVALILCFAALAAAVVPWTTSSDALRASASARLHETTGLALTAAGAGTVAVLPVPRLAFEHVTLTSANRTTVVRGGTLRGELRILPLLLGRLEFAELSLADAAVHVEVGDEPRGAWGQAVEGLRARFDLARGQGHVARLVLDRVNLRLHDRRTGFETSVHGITLAADWPTVAAPVEVTGSMAWRGEIVQIKRASLQPDALAAGRPSPFRMDLSAPQAGLLVAGDLSLGEDQRFVGRATFTARSLRDFSAWSGVPFPLGDVIGAFGLDGDVRLDEQGMSWPAVRLMLGADRLDGALSWRGDGERWVVTGTLAADRLDLTRIAAALPRLRPATGDGDAFLLPPHSGPDLDLRLSASVARIGSVRLDDLAANLSVKPGRFEAAVNRVTINRGVAKGRALMANAGDGIEIKAQSSFDRIDVAALLADLGLPRWASGSAQGQIVLEGSGDSPAEIVRSLHGRALATLRQGEFAGLGLAEMVRRVNGKAEPSPVALRGGRTPFEQASFNLAIANGIVEIGEAKLSGTGLRAALQGRSSLAHQTLAAKASIETGAAASPAAPLVLDITGPWSNPTIVPGGPSLTQRSDAGAPSATVQ